MNKFFITLTLFCVALNAEALKAFCDKNDAENIVICEEAKLGKLEWQDGAEIFQGTWDEAGRYCEDLNLAGRSDWRLPTRSELLSITADSENKLTTNEAFKNAKSAYYWSSVKNSADSSNAWAVSFKGSEGAWGIKLTNRYYVRCVRVVKSPQAGQNMRPKSNEPKVLDDIFKVISNLAEPKIVPSDYILLKHNNFMRRNDLKEVVIDTAYRLMWQDGAEIFQGTLDEAKQYCKDLNFAGFSDWKLPSRKELISITDGRYYSSGSINPVFKNFETGLYWSNTKHAEYPSIMLLISFDLFGGVGWAGENADCFARCVREY